MEELPQEPYEIAVIERQGAEASAVAAWRGLLLAATEAASRCGAGSRRLIATRWMIDADGQPVPCSGNGGARSSPLSVIALPDDFCAAHLDARGVSLLARWLRTHHEGGSTIAASNSAARLLECVGVTPLVPSALPHAACIPQVDDTGDILTARGESAWLYIGLRVVHRVYGAEVMDITAAKLDLCHRAMVAAGLHHFAPDFSHGDPAVLRAQRWLHTNLAVGIDLEGLCRVADLHPRTLQRRFSRATGTGPIEYAQRIRISHAQRLILRGVRIGDVPHRVGYSDSSAFRRVFRRISGCTPSMYVRYVFRSQSLR